MCSVSQVPLVEMECFYSSVARAAYRQRAARSVCTVCGHVDEKAFLLSAASGSLCTEKECLENLTGALLSHRRQMGMFST